LREALLRKGKRREAKMTTTKSKPLGTPGLTAGFADAELVRQIKKSVPGMAHFSATGPFGTACKDCAHYGLWQQIKNQAGDTVNTVFHRGRCAKFRELTNNIGPALPPNTESCRHFQRRKAETSR
jgi:hypothetical protein